MTEPTRSRTGVFRKILYTLGVVLVIAAVCEFLIAAFNLAPRYVDLLTVWNPVKDRDIFTRGGVFRFHPEWLWEPRPHAEAHGDFINEGGYRGPFAPEEKGDAIRIATLGDSSTFGFGLREKNSWPRQLENELRERGHRVEVLNFGVVGYSIYQGERLYQGRGREYKPDIVVAAFGAVNDSLQVNSRFTDEEKTGYTTRPVYQLRVFLKRLDTFRFLEEAIGATGTYTKTMDGDVDENGPRRVPLEDFDTILSRLVRTVDEDGGKTLIVSPPRRLDGEETFPDTTKYTDQIHRTAAKLGFTVCDVYEEFRTQDMKLKDEQDPRESALFIDPWHPSPRGHRRYAEMVADALEQSGVFSGGNQEPAGK